MSCERCERYRAAGGTAPCESCHIAKLEAEQHRLEAENRSLREPLVERYACKRCGRRDGLDAVLTDAEWQQIGGDQWGILCLWCMDALALEHKLSTGVALYFAGRALHGVLEHAQAEAIAIAVQSATAGYQARIEALEVDIESGEPENRRRLLSHALKRAEAAEAALTAKDEELRSLREALPPGEIPCTCPDPEYANQDHEEGCPRLLAERRMKREQISEASVRQLIAKWRAEAAHKDSFHATMGVGWKACADDLEALLAKHPPTPQCIGYPNCDGDLEGEQHSPECPAFSPPCEPSPVEQEKP